MSRNLLGYNQKITMEWLDVTASKVAEGCSSTEVREHLFSLLDGVVGGRRTASARSKTVAVLTRIWSNVPPECVKLQRSAIKLLRDADPGQRLATHWAMATGCYIFFSDAAIAVGRLLELQGLVSQRQLCRRLQEVWGDRSTLHRSSQLAIRNMVLWGVLLDTETRGTYKATPTKISVGKEISQLLLEAYLVHGDDMTIPVENITRHPGFFPFDLQISTNDLRQSNRFEVHRQGLNTDVVRLMSE
jgi:hypothetical protein